MTESDMVAFRHTAHGFCHTHTIIVQLCDDNRLQAFRRRVLRLLFILRANTLMLTLHFVVFIKKKKRKPMKRTGREWQTKNKVEN